jgi:hypothetical protein
MLSILHRGLLDHLICMSMVKPWMVLWPTSFGLIGWLWGRGPLKPKISVHLLLRLFPMVSPIPVYCQKLVDGGLCPVSRASPQRIKLVLTSAPAVASNYWKLPLRDGRAEEYRKKWNIIRSTRPAPIVFLSWRYRYRLSHRHRSPSVCWLRLRPPLLEKLARPPPPGDASSSHPSSSLLSISSSRRPTPSLAGTQHLL